MKWTDELIKEHLLESIKILGLTRMPTANELKRIGRNDLHCKVSRTKKYSGWADELNLKLSRCETRIGNEYEVIVGEHLESLGFKVEQMSTKHPYDLYVDGHVKIDVKVANKYRSVSGSEWWTFNLEKEYPSCDIYICVCLSDIKSEEKTLVIPSHYVKMKSLNIGKVSKYDTYIESYNYIDDYSIFFRSIK